MTQWIYKPLLLLLLVGWVSAATYADGRRDYTKTIKKEFDITKDGEVGLSNQFGKIELNTWNKDRVKIAITIIARTDSEDNAQEIFDRIDVDFANGRDYVKAVTEIKSRKSSWWGGWNNKSDFSINYEVFVPKTIELDIKNRHGDTYIVEMAGDAELNIKHGNITADGFSGELDLSLAHGNGTIVAAKSLEGSISHSNIRFKKLGIIDVETAHSNINFGDASKIKLNARHTNFEMGDIDELRVDSRHSHFEIDAANSIFSESQHSVYEIDKVSKNLDFDFSHGGATINSLEKGFDEVTLSGSHASFKINVDDSAAFDLDAYGTHAGIRYPMDLDVRYEKDKNHSQEVRGTKGSGDKGVIKARLSHGGLKIR
jgi:hypothetical protein